MTIFRDHKKKVLLVDFLDLGDHVTARLYSDTTDRLQPVLLRRGVIIEHNTTKFRANDRTGTGYSAKFGELRLRLKSDGTCAETRFGLSAKWTSPFKSAGESVQSTTDSRSVRICEHRLYYI